jgi:EAL domain-containing protein (putative c-di-GMP-specific phosphodiesterase class I)/FixJ family two-component response regulator
MSNSKTYLSAMVIDDEAFMRKLIAFQLRALGCKAVLCHESGKDALDALSEPDHDIQLVVCDLQMPIMDGIEVVRRLGAMAYKGSLILVSGEDQRTLNMAERLAKEHGLHVLGVLNKPVQPNQLTLLMNTLINESAVSAPTQPKPRGKMSASELARGIGHGQLINHYQPKVCMGTGEVIGMEALVRWQHPEHGLVYPDAFISTAEEHGLIDLLTQAVIGGPHGALRHLKQWLDAGLNMHVAVNVSMDNLTSLSFPDFITQAASEANVSLSHLVLEITESRLNSDVRSVRDVLTRMRLKRVRLSIDDFGTGYSSLAQLHELPFDELKIDKQFVHQAHQDKALNSLLEASVNMALDLQMKTTGEGVETEEDWMHLQSKGCDLAQGYWIAKPMAPECVLPWISSWREKVASRPELFRRVGGETAMSQRSEWSLSPSEQGNHA